MSLMQAQRQGEKYPKSTLLKSSNDLGWSTLFAELRSHSRYEGPGGAPPPDTDVGIVVRGSDEGLATYKVGGSRWSARPTTGSIWLKPIGGKYDEAHIRHPKVEALHLYVPSVAFARLSDDYNLPANGTFHPLFLWCAGRSHQPDRPVSAVGDDVPDRRGPHAGGNVVAAACGTAGAQALRDRARPTPDTVATSSG
jgi:hypothetical protein